MLFNPFYVASATFGDASSETATSPPVLYPNVKYPGRIDKSMGCFKSPSQAGRTISTPFSDPDACSHGSHASCEVPQRKNPSLWCWIISSFASEGDYSQTRLVKFRITLVFLHNLCYVGYFLWSLRFDLYSLEGLKGGCRFFLGLP
jgi:hypothetical protein